MHANSQEERQTIAHDKDDRSLEDTTQPPKELNLLRREKSAVGQDCGTGGKTSGEVSTRPQKTPLLRVKLQG